jgi:hypothetical protein
MFMTRRFPPYAPVLVEFASSNGVRELGDDSLFISSA